MPANVIHRLLRGWRDDRVTLLAVESVGSAGDQAMLEVVRAQMEARGKQLSIIYLPGWRPMPLRGAHRDVLLAPSARKYLQLLNAIGRAGHVMAIGADMLDGSYNPAIIHRWLDMIEAAGRLGCRTAILNFSFSEKPDPAICARLAALSGVTFAPREGVSLDRFTRQTGQPGIQSADIAFLLEPAIESPEARKAEDWLRAQKAQGHVILGINASGHTLGRMQEDGIAAYVRLCEAWLDADPKRSILFMPHDFRRPGVGDVDALDKIDAALPERLRSRARMLRPPFHAWDIKGLCGLLDGMLTGRMHLTIAGLGMGVPSMAVVYLGKFEGLMARFGYDGLLVTPEMFPDSAAMGERLERFTANLPVLQAQARERLPEVRALAMRQFDWIG